MTARARSGPWAPVLVALVLAGVAPARPTLADDTASARADRLFEAGKERLAQGDHAAACPLLAESFQLDPASGALLALALCHERAGMLASAQREYAEVAARSRKEGRADRERAARERADALARELSTLTIEYAGRERGHDGLELRIDGAVVAPYELGKPLPLDGGEHAIEVVASGKQPWRAHVGVAPRGDAKTLVVPPLQSELPQPPPAATPSRAARMAAASGAQPRARDADPGRGWTADEWVGVATFGAGIAALGVGTVLAIQAGGESDMPREHCSGGVCTYREGADGASDAAVLSLVTGGVLAAAGLVIYLSCGPPSSSGAAGKVGPSLAAAWVGPRAAGASLRGRF